MTGGYSITIHLTSLNIAAAGTGTTFAPSALTLPILAVLLTTLSGQPSEGATVVSSVHYQKKIIMTCASVVCAGNLPAPGVGKRLNLTRMNCGLFGSGGSTISYGKLDLRNASNSVVLVQYLPGVFSSPSGVHTINQEVDVQVAATQQIAVSLLMASGSAGSAECTGTGTLDTLQ